MPEDYKPGHSLAPAYAWKVGIAPKDRGYTILEAIDEITDEQMEILESFFDSFSAPVEQLRTLHLTLTRIRTAAKDRWK